MKRILLLIFTISIFASIETLQAQTAPGKQWDKSIGGTDGDGAYCIANTLDGGYILGGMSSSSIGGHKSQASRGANDYWIVKIDAFGIKQWDKTFGGSDEEEITSIQQTSDGGYILGGYSKSNISGDKSQASRGANDYWVVKTDAFGAKQWDKTFGGIFFELLTSVKQTSDGGYILGGTSASGISGDRTQPSKGGALTTDYWVVKIDSNGNKQWDKAFGGIYDEALESLCQTSDGGYILGGSSSSPISGDKSQNGVQNSGDYWVIKIDVNGIKQWDKTFGGSLSDELIGLQQTSDGGYILGGTSDSGISGDKSQNKRGTYDYWLVKLNSIGIKQWDKTFGGSNTDYFSSLVQTSDGGYIMTGNSDSGISADKTGGGCGYTDIWMVKIDASGNKQWDKTLATNGSDYSNSILQTSDGGYLIGGRTTAGISCDKSEDTQGTSDCWIIKLNPNCSDLSASLLVDCSTGTNVSLNISGLYSTTNSTPSWTLNYTKDGISQTATGTTPTFALAQNAAVGTVFSLVSITAGTCTTNLSNSLTIQSIPTVAPSVVPGNNCGAGSVTLSATGAPAGGSYAWFNVSTGGTAINTNPSGIFITPSLNTTTTYYVAATNNAGCEGPRTAVTATINSLPVVTVGANQSICATAAPIQLTGFSPSGGVWSGSGVNSSGLFTPASSLTGNQALIYTVTQNGCTASATQIITVTAPPSVNAGANETICANAAPVQLSGFSPAGGAWSGSGVNASGVFTPGSTLVGNQTLTYTVTQNGCSVSGTKQVIVPAVISQPAINLISPDTLISSVAGSSYTWKLNNTTLPTTTRKLKAMASGNYSVQVKDANNCTSVFSSDYSFRISGLKKINSAEVRIYPNPTKGLLNLEFAESLNASVKVYNALGQCILAKAVSKQEKEINLDLTNAAKGIYTIQVTAEKQSLIKKIVLE